MTCSIRKLPTGGMTVICGSHSYVPKGQRCRFCSALGDKLCDWPTGEMTTCDVRMCAAHAQHVGDDMDYCPDHVLLEPLKPLDEAKP